MTLLNGIVRKNRDRDGIDERREEKRPAGAVNASVG
jgi:hypothetical protein